MPVEKQPLSDARKGRARGPARRKPAVEKTSPTLPTIPEIKITEALNIWQVDQDGKVVVGTSKKEEKSAVAVKEPSVTAERPMAPPIAKNTAGESVDPTPESPVLEDMTSPRTTTADVYPIQTPAETSKSAGSSPIATESADKQEGKDDMDVTKSAEPAAVPAGSPESVSVPTNLDDALEEMAASADGKRESDGSIHPEL